MEDERKRGESDTIQHQCLGTHMRVIKPERDKGEITECKTPGLLVILCRGRQEVSVGIGPVRGSWYGWENAIHHTGDGYMAI